MTRAWKRGMGFSRRAQSGWKRAAVACAAASLALAGATGTAAAQAARPIVYVIPIEGIIDMGLAPFVQRTIAEASESSASAVILRINTFGGRLDAAVLIRDALLTSPVPTVAFVSPRAISAGALISLAAERIAMADGGTLGAATPVMMGAPGGGAAPVEEKSVSYVRKEFRATADARNRPPLIAEAMVDADVEIPGVIEKGKLLTLTTDEALANGVADFEAADLEAVLAELGLTGAEIRISTPNWGERFVRLLTHPIVASLLLSAAMLGILIEIRTPGFGVPGALGLISLVLVLGGHYTVQLVGWEEIILVTVGLILIGVEVFVIPGFGFAGVGGIAALLAGLSLGMVGKGATIAAIISAAGRVTFSMLAAIALSLLAFRLLTKTSLTGRLVLASSLPPGGGEGSIAAAEQPSSDMLGRRGTTITALRPAGLAEFDGERVDVVSNGEMIEPGTAIVVHRQDGNRIVVRRHRGTEQGSNT
jgi:membrane-bound serine protease (ClpP class)